MMFSELVLWVNERRLTCAQCANRKLPKYMCITPVLKLAAIVFQKYFSNKSQKNNIYWNSFLYKDFEFYVTRVAII